MRDMKTSSFMSLVILVGRVALSRAPFTTSHLLPFSQKLRVGLPLYSTIWPLLAMSPTPVMNLIGFLRVTFLSLKSPEMQLQSTNSALGLLRPRQGESRKEGL